MASCRYIEATIGGPLAVARPRRDEMVISTCLGLGTGQNLMAVFGSRMRILCTPSRARLTEDLNDSHPHAFEAAEISLIESWFENFYGSLHAADSVLLEEKATMTDYDRSNQCQPHRRNLQTQEGKPMPRRQSESLCHAEQHNKPLSDWRMLNETLGEYGHSVITSWIQNRSIFSRVKGLTGVTLPCFPELTESGAASELAGVTVTVSLVSFRRMLENGTGWQPCKGASLRTYFIGQCLMCFPNEYRRWTRENRAGRISVDYSQSVEQVEIADHTLEPCRIVLARAAVTQLLDQVPERVQLALICTAAGYSQREISAMIKTTPKGVEMLLHRFRAQCRRSRDEWLVVDS